jgi:hypothetical protein
MSHYIIILIRMNNYIIPHASSDIKSLHVTYYGWHDLPQSLWIINEYFKLSLSCQPSWIFIRSLNGDGMFNYRKVFPFEYSKTKHRVIVMKKVRIKYARFASWSFSRWGCKILKFKLNQLFCVCWCYVLRSIWCLRCYSEYSSTPGKLKSLLGHGGNRTRDLWDTSPMFCHS